MNVYDDVSIDKNNNQNRKRVCMDGSGSMLYMVYIKKYILALSTYYFIIGKSVAKENEHIKERIADFRAFKE